MFAPTSTSSTSQTLHNTATQPIPVSPQLMTLEAEDAARVSSSPLSSPTVSNFAPPLKDTPGKRGRPKKVKTSPQLPPKQATRGRGRPKKISSSPQISKAMKRSRVKAPTEIDEPRDNEVADTPVNDEVNDSDDDGGDNGNDGEIGSELLNMAFDAVHSATPPEPAKNKRGMPKGGWKKSKKTNITTTPKMRPTRDAAVKSAERISANYALTSDPVADNSGLDLAYENAKRDARALQQALLDREDAENSEVDGGQDAAPPPAKKRGRPPKNLSGAEQPAEPEPRRARLLQGIDEPVTVDADETPFIGENTGVKRKRGRPLKETVTESAEAATSGPSKGRGRKKAVATNGIELIDPDRLRMRGFTFAMRKKTKNGVQRDVIEAQFDFAVGEEEEGYELEKTEDGGFKMNFNNEF